MDYDALYRQTLKTGPGGPGLDTSHGVGAALSGGGVRAALFGLGVLMAMHDAGKEPQNITSVSGGSITNMMLSRRYFATPADARPDWELATVETFDALRAGSLTRPWIALMIGLLAYPLVTVPLAFAVAGSTGWAIGATTTIVWLVALALRGQLIEAVIARRYLGRGWTGRHLCDLQPGPTQQVFCCTDLVLGQPVYFSSTGEAFRRTHTIGGGALPATVRRLRDVALDHGHRYNAESARLSLILRATAGFPGIPPRLARWHYKVEQDAASPADPANPEVGPDPAPPPVAFLSEAVSGTTSPPSPASTASCASRPVPTTSWLPTPPEGCARSAPDRCAYPAGPTCRRWCGRRRSRTRTRSAHAAPCTTTICSWNCARRRRCGSPGREFMASCRLLKRPVRS